MHSYSLAGWFGGIGVGIDARTCSWICVGLGVSASEQFVAYEFRPPVPSIRFPAAVLQVSAVAEIPLGAVRIAVRVGPRRKWVQSSSYPAEDDPQPGLSSELLVTWPVR